MEEARLSQRERRILAEIENDLRKDEPLDRRLRTMRRGTPLPKDVARGVRGGVRRHRSGLGVALLGALTLALLVLAVATEAPALIWAFAAVWVLTLCCLLRLVIRWSRRLHERTGPS